MPVAFAFVAGGLAILNPCSFAMLPAFLSLYVGTSDADLPRAPTHTLQGILAGLAVTAGFLFVVITLGLPIALGAGQVTKAVPWVGLSLGSVMALFAVFTLAGVRIELPARVSRANGRWRSLSLVAFGAGYGVASLSCTLPVLMALIGSSLAVPGNLGTLVVFGAYSSGVAVVLVSLSISTAILRDGIARTLIRTLPYMRWMTGSLLLIVAAYLLYYWGQLLFASVGARSGDPVVALVQRSTSVVETWIRSGVAPWLLLGATTIVAMVALMALWRWAWEPSDAVDADRPGLKGSRYSAEFTGATRSDPAPGPCDDLDDGDAATTVPPR